MRSVSGSLVNRCAFPAGASPSFSAKLTTNTHRECSLSHDSNSRRYKHTPYLILHVPVGSYTYLHNKDNPSKRSLWGSYCDQLFLSSKCATKHYKAHNALGHGSTFDLLFKQAQRVTPPVSAAVSATSGTTNGDLFSLLLCTPPQYLEGVEVCVAASANHAACLYYILVNSKCSQNLFSLILGQLDSCAMSGFVIINA